MKKNLLLALLVFGGLNAVSAFGAEGAAEGPPPGVGEPPKGTAAFDSTLCKTRKDKAAYSFVSLQAKYDKKGCTKPVKAFVWDSRSAKWKATDAKSVTCCDPAKKPGR